MFTFIHKGNMKNRISTIIQIEQHTPSSFADAIGVSRSSMNHILNGRNNPSLEVATKILTAFPRINSDWLLFGKEPMFKNQTGSFQGDLFQQSVVKATEHPQENKYARENELKGSEKEDNLPIVSELVAQTVVSKKIDKIIIMYSDKTFDTLSIEK